MLITLKQLFMVSFIFTFDKKLQQKDCNWGDHVGMVASACREEDNGKGVAGYRTPNGLGVADWRKGIEHYAEMQKQQ